MIITSWIFRGIPISLSPRSAIVFSWRKETAESQRARIKGNLSCCWRRRTRRWMWMEFSVSRLCPCIPYLWTYYTLDARFASVWGFNLGVQYSEESRSGTNVKKPDAYTWTHELIARIIKTYNNTCACACVRVSINSSERIKKCQLPWINTFTTINVWKKQQWTHTHTQTQIQRHANTYIREEIGHRDLVHGWNIQ